MLKRFDNPHVLVVQDDDPVNVYDPIKFVDLLNQEIISYNAEHVNLGSPAQVYFNAMQADDKWIDKFKAARLEMAKQIEARIPSVLKSNNCEVWLLDGAYFLNTFKNSQSLPPKKFNAIMRSDAVAIIKAMEYCNQKNLKTMKKNGFDMTRYNELTEYAKRKMAENERNRKY